MGNVLPIQLIKAVLREDRPGGTLVHFGAYKAAHLGRSGYAETPRPRCPKRVPPCANCLILWGATDIVRVGEIDPRRFSGAASIRQ